MPRVCLIHWLCPFDAAGFCLIYLLEAAMISFVYLHTSILWFIYLLYALDAARI